MNKVLLEIPGIGHNESVLCIIYSDVWIGSIEMFGPKRQNIYPFRIIVLNVNINTYRSCMSCEKKISASDSLCEECMSKYKIKRYNDGNDGCGCDR